MGLLHRHQEHTQYSNWPGLLKPGTPECGMEEIVIVKEPEEETAHGYVVGCRGNLRGEHVGEQ